MTTLMDINKQTDIFNVYNKLLDGFKKIYPDKHVLVNETEVNSLVRNFCDKFRNDQSMFALLINRDNKLFKGLKCSLIPKFKMEVILKPDNDYKVILNDMWNNISLLYLLGEAEHTDPNRINMGRVAFALDLHTKTNESNDGDSVGKLFSAFQNVDKTEMEGMIGNLGISKDQLESLKSGLDSDQLKDVLGSLDLNNIDLSKLSEMDLSKIGSLANIDLSGISLKPTENSSRFLDEILGDLKTKFKLDDVDGKVDSKQFVEQLMTVGNSLSDTYGKKLSTGELSINDILGGITSIASNPNQNVISDLTDSLNLDKLDVKEIIGELKGKLNGKVPAELLDTVCNLDGSTLKNMNIGDLIGSMMGGKNDVPKELTDDQKKELMNYYSTLEL